MNPFESASDARREWLGDRAMARLGYGQAAKFFPSKTTLMNIIPFNFGEHELRTVTLDGEPWFIGRDAAMALGYKVPKDAISAHCKGAVKRRLPSASGDQDYTLIPESDLYRLIMRSKLPSAEKFADWVTSEVLPTIRKTGGYILPRSLPDALRALADAEEEKTRLSEENLRLLPKAEFADAVMASEDCIAIGDAAKVLGLGFGRTTLFKELRSRGILMKNNVPYQEYIDRGYFRVTESKWDHPETGVHITLTTKVLQPGLDYLRRLFLKEAA